MNLSKSRYTSGVTCKKKLWLSCYKSDEALDTGNEIVLANGNRVGDLARHLFGDDYVLIDFDKGFQSMINETKKCLDNNTNVICEASFNYDGNFCSVDVLRNNKDGVEIYEVKSSTGIDKIYLDDIAYQTWVLKKCGLNVLKSCLVYVNSDYVKHGKLNINEYFNIEDVSEDIDLDSVENSIKELKEVISKDKEPNIDLSINCHNPYDCPFFKYCTKNLVSPNVFDLGWNTKFTKKLDMYYRGHISYKDIIDKEVVNDKATEQIRFSIKDLPPKINKSNIKEFLSSLKYPLYFLDFESFQDPIPSIDGTKPYQQICFQYSLHILDEDNNLIHKEYLSDDYEGNPMYGLCKQLCEDIPLNSCVIAYHKSFECSRLKEMSNLFPEFSDHLLNISNHIVDIEIPFARQDYYVKDMAGRSSIKVVLPALYPNDPDLDYHNLDQVHKGDEASSAYLSLKDLSKDEQEVLRHNMLKYCCLDTYAMVKIYEKLRSL